jgi:hypothetical protein
LVLIASLFFIRLPLFLGRSSFSGGASVLTSDFELKEASDMRHAPGQGPAAPRDGTGPVAWAGSPQAWVPLLAESRPLYMRTSSKSCSCASTLKLTVLIWNSSYILTIFWTKMQFWMTKPLEPSDNFLSRFFFSFLTYSILSLKYRKYIERGRGRFRLLKLASCTAATPGSQAAVPISATWTWFFWMSEMIGTYRNSVSGMIHVY